MVIDNRKPFVDVLNRRQGRSGSQIGVRLGRETRADRFRSMSSVRGRD